MAPEAAEDERDCVRRGLRVRGQVQGVGFRPYVYRLAHELGLAGWVRNDGEGVEIEVQGSAGSVDALIARLPREAPPLARISALEAYRRPISRPEGFAILASGTARASTEVPPDACICDDCLGELLDPDNRRYRYAFINCTQCGPRYTITRALPYDRAQTSMAVFAQCPSCSGEYERPQDRRFHAEPNACPDCGPRLTMRDGAGAPLPAADPVAETVRRLRRGQIVAIKGLGGFHLACDADDAAAVERLRARKQREAKPFALMVANAASAAALAQIGEPERALLESRERPIVLARKREGREPAGIAPGIAWLGLMLPYTPLHWLLFHEAAGRPHGAAWTGLPQQLRLVMTSANPGGEPLVVGNDEALARLAGIADAFLLHDRDIVTRCDDSVVRPLPHDRTRPSTPRFREPQGRSQSALQFVRRARGYTPGVVRLPRAGASVLACGPFLKNTICLTRGESAFVSQHVGDLDNAGACAALEEAVERLTALLQVRPQAVAHDLHEDFFSTRYAADYASARGIPLVAVQHHHAHVAAVMAEHGLEAEVLGLALDGVGLGNDGTAWGGELLHAQAASFERIGHLAPLALPGADKAAREPWRMAAAALHRMGRGGEIEARFPFGASKLLPRMLASGAHCPPTTSAGRWFDAAAGLLGVKPVAAYEGQAAMLLEGLAQANGPVAPWQGGWRIENGALDLLPLLGRLADEPDAGRGAALFHATLVAALADWVCEEARHRGLRRVVLGGGCFLNGLLSEGLREALGKRDLMVFEARQVPPSDGGLSLGQAWVAMNTIS